MKALRTADCGLRSRKARSALLVLVAAVLTLASAGCSLLTFKGGGAAPIKAPTIAELTAAAPVPTPARIEDRQQAAAFVAGVLDRLKGDLSAAQAAVDNAVTQAAKLAALVSQDVGPPARPVAVPDAPITDPAPAAA